MHKESPITNIPTGISVMNLFTSLSRVQRAKNHGSLLWNSEKSTYFYTFYKVDSAHGHLRSMKSLKETERETHLIGCYFLK